MINEVEVSKGVPLPLPKKRFPYNVMDVGDSFFVEGSTLQLVCNYNYRAGKRFGKKFIARREDSGVRVWRTA